MKASAKWAFILGAALGFSPACHGQAVAGMDRPAAMLAGASAGVTAPAATGSSQTHPISAYPSRLSTTNQTAATAPAIPRQLTLEIHCTNDVFKVGDEIPVQFIVRNVGTNGFFYNDPSRNSGRLDEYRLTARLASGEYVPDPRLGRTNSDDAVRSSGNYGTLPPGESLTRIIPLNCWAAIKDPGRYEITGVYFTPLQAITNAVSDPITITVLPRSKEEMDEFIQGLTNQVAARLAMQAGKTAKAYDPVLHELVVKLMFTGSPGIVPSLFKIMEESSHEGRWFNDALAYYVPHTEDIRQALIAESAKVDMDVNITNWLQSATNGTWTNRDNADAGTRNWLRFAIRNYALTNQASLAGAEVVGSTSGLSLEVRCTNDVLKAGDEIPIEFIVNNLGTSDYKYEDRTYDRSGRMNEYQLYVKKADGSFIPDPRQNFIAGMGGGLFQYGILHPGESFSKIISLNRWALLNEPGDYEVLATFLGGGAFGDQWQVKADPLSITVLPRTPEEMDDYIRGLTNQVMVELAKPRPTNGPPKQELTDLVMKLMYTCNPAIVPALLQILHDDGPEILKDGSTRSRGNEGFYVNEALLYYVPHSESVGDAIVAAATRNGSIGNLDGVLRGYEFDKAKLKPLIARALAARNDDLGEWANGARLAAHTYYDDSFLPALIAIAINTNANANSRGAAMDALAYNRTEPGVSALRSLLNDPDPALWTPLAIAIENGLNNQVATPTGRHLLPADFSCAEVRPLLERMLVSPNMTDRIFGTSLAETYGDDALTAKLVVLATSPEMATRDRAVYALALNRTDAGIKTLKALLNDPDSQVSQMAADAIRHAYTERGDARGRPLLPSDFDTKYGSPGMKPDTNELR
jgi:Tfp pilus assembly protein PilN